LGLRVSPLRVGSELRTRRLYIHGADGNGIELYVDASDVGRTDPQDRGHPRAADSLSLLPT